MSIKGLLFSLSVFFLPSTIKIALLRLQGHEIGNNCYIGFSLIHARKISLGDQCYIGHGNIVWRLENFFMGKGSRISLLNWITGAGVGSFELGKNSSISIMHFFEASACIAVGDNSIVAGRSSQFFTHGITPDNLNDRRAINIGDWCCIGSAVRFVPGVTIADHTFVGMGAVVTKNFQDNYVLIAGSPARIKKKLSQESIFFKRSYLPHAHHPQSYSG